MDLEWEFGGVLRLELSQLDLSRVLTNATSRKMIILIKTGIKTGMK